MLTSFVVALALAQSGADSAECLRPAPMAATPSATEWLSRAKRAVGWQIAGDRVLQLRATDAVLQNYQSDRTYSPFFSAFQAEDVWLDLATGVERQVTASVTYPGQTSPGATLLSTERSTIFLRDTLVRPVPTLHAGALHNRALNPWAELADWSADTTSRVAGSCRYRDYDRVALARTGPFGRELFLLDLKTAYPIAVIRDEPHYLWGQVQAEYVYTTWIEADHVAFPGAVFRLTDRAVDISRTVSRLALTPRDSAPRLAMPADAPAMTPTVAAFLTPAPPDTIRVGPTTFLLKNIGYTEMVTLAKDTVFVFDATQGDARARADSAWVGKLFPGKHPVVVVVTDLAWPHVAGVRFWVASGATIVSHRASRAFLEEVVNRRWTLTPDKLEHARSTAALHFRPANDSLNLAGGAIGLYAIDGIASEGALMGFVRGDKFLWASDFVQTLSEATQYGREVDAAVRRVGISPERLAAEHLPLSQWAQLVRLLN